ncbi:MAG: hypothetical protein B6I28_03120 [Fusobacteriia bacterium 4572_132]|nr:MAG: hypothetical protein B6I28_03120 [Fusobacteriia bacterium 4572_132]
MLLLLVLIILSGVFSASETALTAFKSIELKKIEKENHKKAAVLKLWLKKPNEILTTILLGNNIVNILASSIATVLTGKILATKFGNYSHPILITTFLMTTVILIFGEITPKILAKNFPDKISKIVIMPIYYLSIVSFPIIFILTLISKIITRSFGIKMATENVLITEAEIKSMVIVGEEEGILEKKEKEMIHGVFNFGESSVKDVMVPRINMFAIEGNKTLEEMWDIMLEKGYSRIPVYEEKIDNIIGVVYLKDLLNIAKENKLNKKIKEFVRKAYFVPDSKLLIELLQSFRTKKVHIAIAFDEYSGTVGMVTIEDLIEEIVGEIEDEFDNEEEKIIKKDENKYKIDPFLDIDEINKEIEINIPESEEYDTLGGFIYFKLGRVPEVKDEIKEGNIKITIKKIEKNRILEVEVEVEKEGEENEKN